MEVFEVSLDLVDGVGGLLKLILEPLHLLFLGQDLELHEVASSAFPILSPPEEQKADLVVRKSFRANILGLSRPFNHGLVLLETPRPARFYEQPSCLLVDHAEDLSLSGILLVILELFNLAVQLVSVPELVLLFQSNALIQVLFGHLWVVLKPLLHQLKVNLVQLQPCKLLQEPHPLVHFRD